MAFWSFGLQILASQIMNSIDSNVSRMRPIRPVSAFLLGPRGTGKTSWVQARLPEATYLDLLDDGLYRALAAAPERLITFVASPDLPVVIDEIQRIPRLLNEVHRMMETQGIRFVLTGSSARKLNRAGVNLLAGRARTWFMHPFTAEELGDRFSLDHALRFGMLPSVWVDPDPADYLNSYVTTYLAEEIRQEGLTRDIGAFARFLEAASFSQAGMLNVSSVARECSVHRKVVEGYFGILEDLLWSVRLPVFARRAKRETAVRAKFFLFDAGVFRAVRPVGPLDSPAEIDGAALETLVLQHLRATNDALDLGYSMHHWRTRGGLEVDFVLYGERGLHAIEVKRCRQPRLADLRGLREFRSDYPEATTTILCAANRSYREHGVDVVPITEWLRDLGRRLA